MLDVSTICARLCGKPECQSTGAGGRRKLLRASVPAVGMILLGVTLLTLPLNATLAGYVGAVLLEREGVFL